MDYKEYWELCRRVSLIPAGINAAKDVPSNLWVVYEGITYYPVAYEVRWHDGQPYRRAIMHDLKADSLTYGDLDNVEVWNGVQ